MGEWRNGYGSYGERNPAGGSGAARTIILAMLCGALAGGGISYYLMDARQPLSSAKGGSVVTLQIAAPRETVSPNAIEWGGANGISGISGISGIEGVAVAASPSVLEITTNSKAVHPFYGSYVISGAGSGVALSEDGYVITNNHVVTGATTISARTSHGEQFAATLIGADAQTDLAVLKLEGVNLSPIVFADSDAARVGELAVAIGNPLGTLGGTVTEGILSAKDRAIVIGGQTMTLLQTSAAINPGNSGGGLFDGAGHLVGIVVAKANETSSGENVEGIGYAIPSNIVRQVAAEIIEHGYVTGRPALGVVVKTINSRYDLMRYQLQNAGVYVMNTFKNSEILLWDQILTANGQPVASAEDIAAAVAGTPIGDAVPVTVRRQNSELSLSITIREKTPEMADADMV